LLVRAFDLEHKILIVIRIKRDVWKNKFIVIVYAMMCYWSVLKCYIKAVLRDNVNLKTTKKVFVFSKRNILHYMKNLEF